VVDAVKDRGHLETGPSGLSCVKTSCVEADAGGYDPSSATSFG